MKRYLLLTATVLAAVTFFLLSSVAETPATANAFEYATIRWDGRDNTCVILPNGNVDFVGAKLKAVKRPDRVDERAFYMNVVMNSLGRDGFEFAGMSNDQNIIVMKRPFRQAAH
ncbi:MAG: hypothetical protein ACLQU4_20870 [Limisphaerales bacterium]